MTIRVWRTESREVWPFLHASHVFDSCALRLDASEEFDPRRDVFALDEVALGNDIRYEFTLKVDVRRLQEVAKVGPNDVDIALVAENDDARRHEVLKRWESSDLPSRVEGVVSHTRYGPRRLRFRLVAFLNRERCRHLTGSAWRLASVLAERRYFVGLAAANLFRVHWTSFADQHWDRLALWFVQVKDANLLSVDADPDEVIQVHLNRDLPALHALWEPSATRSQRLSPVAALLRPLITADILCDVACIVLRHLGAQQREVRDFDPEQVDAASFACAVLRGLKKGTRLGTAELIELVRDEPEQLKRKIHGFVGVGRAYDMTALERLRG